MWGVVAMATKLDSYPIVKRPVVMEPVVHYFPTLIHTRTHTHAHTTTHTHTHTHTHSTVRPLNTVTLGSSPF